MAIDWPIGLIMVIYRLPLLTLLRYGWHSWSWLGSILPTVWIKQESILLPHRKRFLRLRHDWWRSTIRRWIGHLIVEKGRWGLGYFNWNLALNIFHVMSVISIVFGNKLGFCLFSKASILHAGLVVHGLLTLEEVDLASRLGGPIGWSWGLLCWTLIDNNR